MVNCSVLSSVLRILISGESLLHSLGLVVYIFLYAFNELSMQYPREFSYIVYSEIRSLQD